MEKGAENAEYIRMNIPSPFEEIRFTGSSFTLSDRIRGKIIATNQQNIFDMLYEFSLKCSSMLF